LLIMVENIKKMFYLIFFTELMWSSCLLGKIIISGF